MASFLKAFYRQNYTGVTLEKEPAIPSPDRGIIHDVEYYST